MASQEGHHDVVQTLLGAGADVNIATSDVSDVRVWRGMLQVQVKNGYHSPFSHNHRCSVTCAHHLNKTQ